MDSGIMDHQRAVNNMMAERYLLGELGPQEHDAFEAHLFECSECFEQVRAGMEFVHYIKRIGAEETVAAASRPAWRRLLAQALRPAPALAFAACLLAAAAVYQNLYTIQTLKAPQLETRYILTEQSRSAGEVVNVPAKGRFRLAIEFQPQPEFVAYEAYLAGEDGKVQRSVPFRVGPSQTMIEISFYAGDLKPGRYFMVVQATDRAGHKQELARGPFKLQFQD
jgi:putative zinc finger protein